VAIFFALAASAIIASWLSFMQTSFSVPIVAIMTCAFAIASADAAVSFAVAGRQAIVAIWPDAPAMWSDGGVSAASAATGIAKSASVIDTCRIVDFIAYLGCGWWMDGVSAIMAQMASARR
jgi:hypothetical protein